MTLYFKSVIQDSHRITENYIFFFPGFVFRFHGKISFPQVDLQPETGFSQQFDLLVLPGKICASSIWLNGSDFSIPFRQVNEKKKRHPLELKMECTHGEKGSLASMECWPSCGLLSRECIRICPFFDIVLKTYLWLAKPRVMPTHLECVVINDVVQIRNRLLKWFSWLFPLTVLWFASQRRLGMCGWGLPKVPKTNFLSDETKPNMWCSFIKWYASGLHWVCSSRYQAVSPGNQKKAEIHLVSMLDHHRNLGL